MIYINLSKKICIHLKRMNNYGENLAKNIRRLNDMIDQKKSLIQYEFKKLGVSKKKLYKIYAIHT